MRNITFLGSTSSNYLFGKGRGKDKKKRKSRTILNDAKDFVVGGKKFTEEANLKSPKDLVDIYQRRKDRSSIATNSTAALGAALGASQASKLGMSPATGALIGAFNLSTIGRAADREISKEKARYRKEGARSRLGKIGNDARIGAKSTAGFLAVDETFRAGKRQLMKTNGQPLKRRIIKTVGAGVGGALLGAAKGSAIGAGIGSGVGTIRGFTQKNKKKDRK